MKHNMMLHPGPFNMIKSGNKTIEMRLYDEKRNLINIGDKIIFTDRETGNVLITRVKKLYLFKSFEELYKNFDKEKLGYNSAELANPKDMSKYYSDKDIEKYGVVGIEIEVIYE